MIPLPDHISIGDTYGPAMEIADQADVDAYFAACVEHAMRGGESRAQAERIERFMLRDYAGYYGPEVQRILQ